MTRLRFMFAIGLVVLVCTLPAALVGQYGVKTGDWMSFGGENGSTRYSPLDQINRNNVRNLQVAWTFKTDNYAPSSRHYLHAIRRNGTQCGRFDRSFSTEDMNRTSGLLVVGFLPLGKLSSI